MKNASTCVQIFSSIKVNASHYKPSQVDASHGQTESQVNASFQLAITSDSVWSGLKAFPSTDEI